MKQVTYKCECCGEDFTSGRARNGVKLCAKCIGFRRVLKAMLKGGLSEGVVLERAQKLLGMKPKAKVK